MMIFSQGVACREPSLKVTMLDADAVALKAANRNVAQATCLASDRWQALDDEHTRFDWIVSNPPVHCGIQNDFTVLSALISDAPLHLVTKGILWIVAQEYIPVGVMLSMVDTLEDIEMAFSDGRFTVWKATAV